MAASTALRTWVRLAPDFAGAADAARVPNRKWVSRPRTQGASQPVARDAGLIVDDRDLPTGQPIKQRGFADVGAADDRDVRRVG